ncbi:MAG: B12-binding domain-containing radical SAM protein [Planctomycetes bacterium]|nr:B12-binding domain-containing radical SAM protein [Planctomycetota bacterium]
MNILLVSPLTPDTFWSFNHVMRLVGKKTAFPPLGLLTVAAMLPRDWNLRLIDMNVRSLTDADIAWADAVFLSAMIVHEPSARGVISRSNALGKPVVAGGPLFTSDADRFPEVACCVVGEAEEVMPALISDLLAGGLKRRYQAVEKPRVSDTPLPRWDLIDGRDYVTLSVQFSRGCPFDCEFCDISAVYGRVPRVKEPERVIEELDAVIATGWEGAIFVVDDNFIGNRAKAKRLLRAIIDWREWRGVRVNFTTEASINLVDDPELLDLMVRAGVKNVFIGIESPQEESLKECSKVQNFRRDLAADVRQIHNAGIQVMAGFIVGFDSDRAGIFEYQRRFIQEAGVVTAMVGLLTALPGTRLFARLTREGRMTGRSTGNNLDATLNFTPALDPEVLTEGYRRLVKELYSPREYYQRVLTFLNEYRPCGPRARLRMADFLAFVRSLWVIGVAEPGRWEYWKFLWRSLVSYRRAFPEAVELAIRGYHFRVVAESL